MYNRKIRRGKENWITTNNHLNLYVLLIFASDTIYLSLNTTYKPFEGLICHHQYIQRTVLVITAM